MLNLVRLMMLYALCHLAHAGDGFWNGKPWDKAELEAGVARGDIAALTEWAQWSADSWGGVSYDGEMIRERLKLAHEKGDTLATALYAHCLWSCVGGDRDAEQAVKLAFESAMSEQPYGYYLMSEIFSSRLVETEQVQPSYEMASDWLEKAVAAGVVNAIYRKAYNVYSGEGGYDKDADLGAEMLIEVFNKYHHITAAQVITYDAKEECFNDKLLLLAALDRCNEGVKLERPISQAFMGQIHGLKGVWVKGAPMIYSSLDREHQPFPLHINLALSYGGLFSGKYGSKADYITLEYLARESFANGSRSSYVAGNASSACIVPHDKAMPRDLELAKKISYEYLDGESRFYRLTDLGQLHSFADEPDYYDPVLAEALLLYSCEFHNYRYHVRNAVALLAKLHFDAAEEDRDYRKAYVLNQWLHKKSGWNMYLKGMKACKKKMSASELAEAEDLMDRGYPWADEFRRPAWNYLRSQKIIDESWPYEKEDIE